MLNQVVSKTLTRPDAQARVTSADRKRRTRRAEPFSMKRLMNGLDEFLECDQDRAMFNLEPRGEIQNGR